MRFPNPQSKLLQVNKDNYGVSLADQQGSTIEIYDELSVAAAATEFRFFENVNARQFPQTNLVSNSLPEKESFVVQYIYFCIVTYATGTNNVTDIQTLDGAGLAGLYAGNFSLEISNNRTIKEIPMTSLKTEFNRVSHTNQEVYKFLTKQVIPEQTPFTVKMRASTAQILADSNIRCVMGGIGSLQLLTRGA